MEISENNLRKHVRYLASPELQGREFGSKGNRMAVQYIQEQFKEFGLKTPGKFLDYIQNLPGGGQNLMGISYGNDKELSQECVIIDAHHDHLGNGFVGASDNAAGVGVLLELVRIFAEDSNRRSLLFACFDGEEQLIPIDGKRQTMYGAHHYVDNPIFNLKKTAAMLSLDTLGRNDLGNDMVFILGSERSLFIQDVIYRCSSGIRKIMFDVDILTGVKGNYIPFIKKQIPSLFISNGIHLDYHNKKDTEDKLKYDLLTRDTELMIELISGISNSNEKPDFCKNPISPKSMVEDILYLINLLKMLVSHNNGKAEQFNYIIAKLENKPSNKDLKLGVQIILGFLTPNFAKFYLLLNDAQIAENKKKFATALKYYQEIVSFYDEYRVPHVWIKDVKDKIAELGKKTRSIR